MRRLSWQERPSKRARYDGRRPRVGSERRGTELTDGAVRGQLQSHVEATTVGKRSQPMTGTSSPPKKMKMVDNPWCNFDSGNIAAPHRYATLSTETPLKNGVSGQHEAAVQHGLGGRRLMSRPRRRPDTLVTPPGFSALYRSRLSPYTKQETPQQRREARERERAAQRSPETEMDPLAEPFGADRIQVETADSGGETAGPMKSIAGGARPKEHLKADAKQGGPEHYAVTENDLVPKQVGTRKEILKGRGKSIVLRLSTQQPQTKRQSGLLSIESHVPKKLSKSEDAEEDVFPNEMVTQLMSDYADSQMVVANLRQINKEHEANIVTLTIQLSQFEHRHEEDRLRIEEGCTELRQLREEHDQKLTGMYECIVTFERRHAEDQETIRENRQQLAALTTQLEHTSETSRLELDRFERFKLDSQREFATQQQTLATCLTRLERLRATASRQREWLECSICLGVFVRPVTLNCGHTFCETCIETNRRSAVLPDSCPLCRRVISVSVRSAVIDQLAQELEWCQV